MKRKIKQSVSFAMAFMIFVTMFIVSAYAQPDNNSGAYKVGDIVIYGSYPQSKVKDEKLINKLTEKAGSIDDWTSYGYYSGTGEVKKLVKDEKNSKTEIENVDCTCDGKMFAGDYMRFTDIGLGGEKYRGVFFSSFRPKKTGGSLVTEADDTIQNDNGYKNNTVYWFKYEPLKWRVLDPNTGLVMSDSIIDSQPYNNYILMLEKPTKKENTEKDENTDKYEIFFNANGIKGKNYTTDYSKSSIRSWLDNEFLNSAFDSREKKNIRLTALENNSTCVASEPKNRKTESLKTKDKIFLLSKEDISNKDYGFKSSFFGDEKIKILSGSDYAQCQGLRVNKNLKNFLFTLKAYNNPISQKESSDWWLRMPTVASHIHYIGYDGFFSAGGDISNTSFTCVGVVPAMVLKDLSKTGRPDNPDKQNIFNNKILAKNNGKPIFVTIAVAVVIIMVIILYSLLSYLKKKSK